MTTTTDAVRRAVLRNIAIDSMTWNLPKKEAEALKRFLEETLPRFDMAIHEERLRNTGAAITQVCGVQALQYMLEALVRNTTGPLDGESSESREIRIMAETIKLHGQILGLHGEEQNRPLQIAVAKIKPSCMATAMHEAMRPYFPNGRASIGEVMAACGAIAAGYLAALPEEVRKEKTEAFCFGVRKMVAEGPSE